MRSGKLLLVGALVAGLVACGGGGGDGGEDKAEASPSAELTMENLSSANIDSAGFPWLPGVGAGITKRWDLPVPVKTNGEARAEAAMTAIETRLGKKIFDRTSIESEDESTVTRGIIFRQGTSYVPAGTTDFAAYCANVAAGPNEGGYPASFYDGTTGVIDTKLYINLDNIRCTASSDIVIHEFGHALGLGAHFEGFGEGAAIDEVFWSVLKTLYANPAGTAKADVRIAN